MLHIERLGQRGEGLARTEQGSVFVPHTIPGDTIHAAVAGQSGRLIDIITPSPDREAPFCPYYGTCGGCAIQGYREEAYREWKRGLVVDALTRAGVDAAVDPLIDAHGEGRRRATFHARVDEAGQPRVGFMQARSHQLVAIEFCPLFAPALDGAIAAARAIAEELTTLRKPLDILITATLSGLDVDIRGAGPLDETHTQKLIAAAQRLDLARATNHGRLLIERKPPLLRVGRALVHLPPGAFLQATEKGEASLAELVAQTAVGAKRIADLFCGIGTFALRLAERAEVLAIDGDSAALDALTRAARTTPGLHTIETERRDLMRRPFSPEELVPFDAVLFDPPRAGAEAQAQAFARSRAPLVIAVSCNAQTFARDAAILAAGGYKAEQITPVDQFRQSPHIEIVGIFRRAATKGRARRSLLSG
ncbi:MAG: rRNA (uracil1939-C5)-methyltransferase [Methylobacteriaceae bacterium]|jgi:23S rRNA (uracil1939-C5)-methyltransferase|nr:rRNA (uracil1939-C5)-methyltransferase [Methylobacteriaceae bacterium]